LEEFDPEAQAELFIAMNDLIIEDQATIPLVNRATPAAVAANLKGVAVTPWSEFTWSIADWYFEE
jgi:peptide/nickel transport system substrate-binding protein